MRKETFTNIESLLEDTNNKAELRTQIVNSTDNMLKNSGSLNISDSHSEELLNRYINKHLLFNKPNNLIIPEKDSTLNNETLKALQFIQLNELKLILERINRIEDLNINCKKR